MLARTLTIVALLNATGCTTPIGTWSLDGDTRGLTTEFTDVRRGDRSRPAIERVYAGDAVLLDGQFASVPMLVMTGDADATLAGDAGEPTALHLPRTSLTRTRTDGRVEFFCAEAGLEGLRPAVDPATCVGVRHERATGQLHWVVADLAAGAPRVTAEAPVGTETGIRFNEGRRLTVDEHTLVEEIVFEGFSDGEIRFVRTIYQNRSASTETFGFDYPPRSGIAVYRVGDHAFEITAVTPGQIEYRVQPL